MLNKKNIHTIKTVYDIHYSPSLYDQSIETVDHVLQDRKNMLNC